MVEVPENLRHRYHYKRRPHSTDALIDSLDDMALLRHMGVPRRYRELALLEQEQHPLIEDWISKWPYIYRPQPELNHEKPHLMGTGLALYGPSGAGKTTLSAALLLRLVRLLVPNADPDGHSRWYGACMGGFVSWQEFSRLAREKHGDDDAGAEYEQLTWRMTPTAGVDTRADWLVLDDLSRERATEYNISELTYFLRHRYENGYPTIITTNVGPDDWADQYGPVMGAFMARALIAVEITKGPDR